MQHECRAFSQPDHADLRERVGRARDDDRLRSGRPDARQHSHPRGNAGERISPSSAATWCPSARDSSSSAGSPDARAALRDRRRSSGVRQRGSLSGGGCLVAGGRSPAARRGLAESRMGGRLAASGAMMKYQNALMPTGASVTSTRIHSAWKKTRRTEPGSSAPGGWPIERRSFRRDQVIQWLQRRLPAASSSSDWARLAVRALATVPGGVKSLPGLDVFARPADGPPGASPPHATSGAAGNPRLSAFVSSWIRARTRRLISARRGERVRLWACTNSSAALWMEGCRPSSCCLSRRNASRCAVSSWISTSLRMSSSKPLPLNSEIVRCTAERRLAVCRAISTSSSAIRSSISAAVHRRGLQAHGQHVPSARVRPVPAPTRAASSRSRAPRRAAARAGAPSTGRTRPGRHPSRRAPR